MVEWRSDLQSDRFCLSPNCSHTWRQCCVIVALAAIPSGLIAGALSLLGFWPVAPYCGAELVTLTAGFYLNARRQRYREWLDLDQAELVLRQDGADGCEENRWHRAFAQIIVRQDRYGEPHLYIRSHGREHEFARRLSKDDKEHLLADLRAAIARWR